MAGAPTLESLMGAYYKAKVMGQGATQTAFIDFDNAVGRDPSMRDAAQAMLTELKKVNAGGKRCVISATNAEFLTQALNH